jgi:hypothetical protein
VVAGSAQIDKITGIWDHQNASTRHIDALSQDVDMEGKAMKKRKYLIL